MESFLDNSLFIGKTFGPKVQVKFYGIDLVENTTNVLMKDLVLDDFYIDFNVMLSNDTNVNTAIVTIYNLRKLNRFNIANLAYNVIEVFAGYGEDLNLIFNGEITTVRNELDGTDWKTSIYCASGMRLYEEVYFKKSYKSGTPYKTIIEDLCKATYYPYKIDKPLIPTSLSVYDDKLKLGRTYYGKVKDILTQVCNDVGMHWYLLNGILEVAYKDRMFYTDKEGILLSRLTGMIGSPKFLFRTIKEAKEVDIPNKSKKKKNKEIKDKKEMELVERQRFGAEITACLNPYVKPGRVIKVASMSDENVGVSTDITGNVNLGEKYLVVDTVNFYGNNYGGDFEMKILADYPLAEDEQNVKSVIIK